MGKIWDSEPKNDRFDPLPGLGTMKAVITSGNGGYSKLQYREVRIPEPGPGEVLLKVLAAGVNNTDINTRIGWYSSSVRTDTESAVLNEKKRPSNKKDGGWNKATPFPFIQGTDCCGRIVSASSESFNSIIGARVLVRSCIRHYGFDSMENIWMGSDFDGAFAQYVKVPESEVFTVNCNWSNAELGTIPCSYGTAENMIHRGKVTEGEKILVTGASGGVGSAAVQLAKMRGAFVYAVTSKSKTDQIHSIGADYIFSRDEDLIDRLGEKYFDIIIDNVAGEGFNDKLKLLKRGGRYVSSGAIGGPVVTMDMRNFYLNDLKLIGCTAWDKPVFPNLISYIEKGEIRPLTAKSAPLEEIAEVQKEFLEKKHIGNFVLIPPEL